MARRLAWVALAVLSAYAVFIGGAWWGIYQPGLRLTSVLLAGVALVAWLVLAVRDPGWRPRSALMPAILACLASLAISTAFSRRPGISLEYLGYAVLLGALYLLLVQLLTRDFFRGRFVVLSGALFTATVVGYLGFSAVHWTHWLSVLGRATIPPLRPEFESLTFGNPSTVLTIVALLAIPLVASASWTRRRGVAAVLGVLGIVGLVAFISGSRAGWLALAVAGIVALAAAGTSRTARGHLRAAVTRMGTASRVALVGAIAVAMVLGVALGPTVVQRITAGGEANRVAFVRIALELFGESPVVGTGPGTWVIERPALTLATEPDEYIPHAHNVYAQTLGELGIVGALAGLVLLALVARLLAGAIRDPSAARQRWGWATLIGLVYFAAHQALDFYPNFPSILLAAAIPVAWLDATSREEPGRRSMPTWIRGRSAFAGGLAAVLAAVVLLGAQEVPALSSARAVDLANRGDWAGADAPARDAAAQDPRIASYLFTAGLTAAHVGDHAASAAFFERVVAGDDVPEAWLNLAAEEAILGRDGDAAYAVQQALRLGIQRPAIAIPAGDLAFRLGDRALAVDALRTAMLLAPSFAGDPWWHAEAGREVLFSDALTAAFETGDPNTAWELALMVGYQDKARQLAHDPALDPSTVDFVDAWSGDDAAFGRIIDHCRAEPLNLTLLFWCARLEGRRGNLDAANDFRYLANAQVGGTYRNGAELRVAVAPLVGRTLEGNPAIFWGTYTYRRPTPWDVLVPSLVHLTLQ